MANDLVLCKGRRTVLRYTPHSLESLLIAAPIVFLLVLLFNAYRLGTFSKSNASRKKVRLKRTWHNRAVVMGVIVLLLIIGFLIRFALSL